jgi:hypothetical protein
MAEEEVVLDKWGVPIPQAYRNSVAYKMRQKVAQLPKLGANHLPVKPGPTTDDIFAAAALANTPDPDAATVQIVKAAALAANRDPSAFLKDPVFRAKVATINTSDAVAVGHALSEAHAENPALQAPFVEGRLVAGIADVIRSIEDQGPDGRGPSIHLQALTAGQTAGFNGLDLINNEDFKTATAGIDATDPAAVAKAISHVVAGTPELRKEDCWFNPPPAPGEPEYVPPTRDASGKLVGPQTHQQRMMASIREESDRAAGAGAAQPVNFQQVVR